MRDTIVVIPCFNEASRLRSDDFVAFADAHSWVSFLFVDDGSTDGTPELLRSTQAARPGAFDVVTLARNSGKAEAVRTGMQTALATPARYAGYWDADLSTPLEEIADFRAVLERNSALTLVIGARIRRLGAHVKRDAARHYLGRVFATLASLVRGLAVYDTQCGAKLFRAGDATTQLFAQPFVSRWVFDVEVLARLVALLGRRAAAESVYEFPLPRWRDVGGSKLRSRHMLGALVDLARIARIYAPDRRMRSIHA
jgi:glycosyltransferase involved in cell wall biosynthesis